MNTIGKSELLKSVGIDRWNEIVCQQKMAEQKIEEVRLAEKRRQEEQRQREKEIRIAQKEREQRERIAKRQQKQKQKVEIPFYLLVKLIDKRMRETDVEVLCSDIAACDVKLQKVNEHLCYCPSYEANHNLDILKTLHGQRKTLQSELEAAKQGQLQWIDFAKIHDMPVGLDEQEYGLVTWGEIDRCLKYERRIVLPQWCWGPRYDYGFGYGFGGETKYPPIWHGGTRWKDLDALARAVHENGGGEKFLNLLEEEIEAKLKQQKEEQREEEKNRKKIHASMNVFIDAFVEKLRGCTKKQLLDLIDNILHHEIDKLPSFTFDVDVWSETYHQAFVKAMESK